MPTTLRPRSTAASADEQAPPCPRRSATRSGSCPGSGRPAPIAADDGGDPVHVALATTTAPITLPTQPAVTLTQPGIEAEPASAAAALDTAARVGSAAELFRIMRDQGMTATRVTAVRTALAAAFPLHPVTAASAIAPHAGRLPDSAALIGLLAGTLAPDGTGAPFPAVPGVDLASDPPGRAGAAGLVRMGATAGRRAGRHRRQPSAESWDGTHLGYTAPAQAQLPAGPVDLHLDGYDGTGLDWYVLDRGVLRPAAAPAPPRRRSGPRRSATRECPNPGSGPSNGATSTSTSSPALIRPMPCWPPSPTPTPTTGTSCPVDVAPGATMIDLLQVTDSFGTTTTSRGAVALDAPNGSWRMWELTPATVTATDPALGVRVFLPPGAPPLEGPAHRRPARRPGRTGQPRLDHRADHPRRGRRVRRPQPALATATAS